MTTDIPAFASWEGLHNTFPRCTSSMLVTLAIGVSCGSQSPPFDLARSSGFFKNFGGIAKVLRILIPSQLPSGATIRGLTFAKL